MQLTASNTYKAKKLVKSNPKFSAMESKRFSSEQKFWASNGNGKKMK